MISLLNRDLKVMRNCLFKVNLANMWYRGLYQHLNSSRHKAESEEREYLLLYVVKVDVSLAFTVDDP